jgi:hypothetical protein
MMLDSYRVSNFPNPLAFEFNTLLHFWALGISNFLQLSYVQARLLRWIVKLWRRMENLKNGRVENVKGPVDKPGANCLERGWLTSLSAKAFSDRALFLPNQPNEAKKKFPLIYDVVLTPCRPPYGQKRVRFRA